MGNRKNKPTLFVTIGAPGSGKSYLAERLCKEYGLFHLRSDEIRKYIFPNPAYSPEENIRLFSLLDFLAEKLIATGVGIIYDANFTLRAYRMKLQKIAKKYKTKYAVLWIQTPLAIAIKRAKTRKYHQVGKKVVMGLHNEIELPKNEPVIVIDGTKPYRVQKVLLAKYL